MTRSKKKSVTKDTSNALGIISIVLGIIGIFFWGLLFGTIGLVCGIIGKGKDENKSISTIGIILSVIAILSSILVMFGLVALFSAAAL
jgi:Na+-driven multidrug efflux pump